MTTRRSNDGDLLGKINDSGDYRRRNPGWFEGCMRRFQIKKGAY